MPRRADEPRPEVLKAAAEAAERDSPVRLVRLQRQRVRWCLASCILLVVVIALVPFLPDPPNDVAAPLQLVVGFSALLLSISLLVVLAKTLDIRRLRRTPTRPANAAGALAEEPGPEVLKAAAETAERDSLAVLVRRRRQRVGWCLAFCFSVVAVFVLAPFVPDAPQGAPETTATVLEAALLLLALLVLVAPPVVLVLTLDIRRRRNPPNAMDASPEVISLKRIRRVSVALSCFSVLVVLVNPALAGLLLLCLGHALVMTVLIWRARRPLRLPVLSDVARTPGSDGRLKRKQFMWRSIVAATTGVFFAVNVLLARAGYLANSSPVFAVTYLLGLIAVLIAFVVSVALSLRYGRAVRHDERRRRSKILEWQDVADSEFVLYLRSFTDDVAASRRMVGGLTAEEHFARVLNQIGPVVAVGLPGEDQPQLGAYRLYLDHGVWQESVEALLPLAKLVVIRTGLSEGLSWEVERAVERVLPQRLLIAVDDELEMQRCLSCVRKVHPQVSTSVKLGYRNACGIRGLLVFDGDWHVTALRIRGMGWYKHRSGNVIDPGLARSMYPVFQKLGVEWPRPRIAMLRTLVLALALLPAISYLLQQMRIIAGFVGN